SLPGFFLYFGLLCIYVMTFFRYLVGNQRVFDIRYNEVFKYIESRKEKKTLENIDQVYRRLLAYSERNHLKVDSLLLIVQTFAVVFLAAELCKVLNFEKAYSAVLALDLLWMSFIRVFGRDDDQGESIDTFFSKLIFDYFGITLKNKKYELSS